MPIGSFSSYSFGPHPVLSYLIWQICSDNKPCIKTITEVMKSKRDILGNPVLQIRKE